MAVGSGKSSDFLWFGCFTIVLDIILYHLSGVSDYLSRHIRYCRSAVTVCGGHV